MSGVRGGPRCEPRGGVGSSLGSKREAGGAQIMFMRAVWAQRAEWGFEEGCGLGQQLDKGIQMDMY